jgi:hypothetical protein
MKYSTVVVLLSAAVLSGLASPVHAYTINTTELGKRIRWATDTVSMQMDPEFEIFLGPGEAYASLAIGFDAWRGLPRVPDLVIRPGLPETIGHHDGHPSNGIYLLRDWPYESAKLAVTIVTYEMDSGRLLDADIVVNGQARFKLLPEPMLQGDASYDLAAVLTHEAGHVLGLGESASGQDATMWPYARPDDVDKRTLADDDEDGATTSYLSAPPEAAGGCGPNTVGGRASGRGSWALGLWLLAVLPALRMSRRHQRRALSVLGLALICLSFGFDLPSRESSQGQALLGRVEALIERGTRDDRLTLEKLAGDSDDQVAQRARFALSRALARPGRARVDAFSAEGRARLKSLLGSGDELVVGKAELKDTLNVNGLLFSEFQVTSREGVVKTLRVAGGVQGGIGQRVIDAEPPPSDASELAVVEQANGTQHWAYHRAGVLFGGHLGEDTALEGAL